MSMSEWAEKEVELYKEDCDCYFASCADSALKAFKSLCEDGHSGMSIGVTKKILFRLINGDPLTEIEGRKEDWERCGENQFQCKRMSSLFKTIKNGIATYSDVERVYCKDINSTATYTNGFITRIIDGMYPITMPYMPNGRYCVTVEEFLCDEKNGAFDTIRLISVKGPNETKAINRCFKAAKKSFTEIDFEEYSERKKNAIRNAIRR